MMIPGPRGVNRSLRQISSATLSLSGNSDTLPIAVRTVFRSGALVGYNGSSGRVTFHPRNKTATIVAAYIGKAGTIPNFDGNQVQIKVNSTGTFLLAGGGADVVSDVFAFPYTSGSTLIVAMELSSTTASFTSSLSTDYEGWSKNASGESANTTASGYSVVTGSVYVVSEIELA